MGASIIGNVRFPLVPSSNRSPSGESSDALEQMAGIQEQIKAIRLTNERITEQHKR